MGRAILYAGLATLLAGSAAAQPPAQVSPPTIEARVQLKEPDQALYDTIGRLDPKKAEEMNAEKRYAESLSLLIEDVSLITMYDLSSLNTELKTKVAHSFNGVSFGLLARRQFDSAYNLLTQAQQLTEDGATDDFDTNALNLNIAGALFNMQKYRDAIGAAETYLHNGGAQRELAGKIITISSQRTSEP